MLADTVERLEGWARWMRSHKLSSNCSSLYVLMKESMGGVVSMELPDDEEALLIDAAVARLKCRDRELFDVLWKYFIEGLSYLEIAEQMSCGRSRVKVLRDTAIMWVDGRLDISEAA